MKQETFFFFFFSSLSLSIINNQSEPKRGNYGLVIDLIVFLDQKKKEEKKITAKKKFRDKNTRDTQVDITYHLQQDTHYNTRGTQKKQTIPLHTKRTIKSKERT